MLKKISLSIAGLAMAATAVFAASHAGPFDGAITARKSHMQLYGHNVGVLGGMAQGKMDYDADAASAAANNLVALVNMSQGTYWPQGSDSASVEGTRALPAIWEDFPGVMAQIGGLQKAAAGMQDAAGGGLESLQAAMGPLGGACGACHKAYRQAQ
jgi:cytochrome c556